MKHLFIFLLAVIIIPLTVSANIINVPSDQPSIQAGINAATNGDTVLVADSTYYENINFNGKAITVASHFILDQDTSHISQTIINGSQPSHPDSGSVVYFVSGEDTTSVLCGFTITGGTGTNYTTDSRHCKAGGGIFSYYSGPRISNNRIEYNTLYHATRRTRGGGIFTGPIGSDTQIFIEDNIIRFNTVEAADGFANGGGIRISSNGNVIRNQISDNEAICSAGNWASGGGGISCYNENTKPFKFVRVKENIVTNNQTISNAFYAGVSGADFVYTNALIENNIITNNIADGATGNGSGLRLFSSYSSSIVKNNLISSNIGGGLILYSTDGIIVQGNRFENNKGSGIEELTCENTQIIQNEFVGNVSGSGGGIFEKQCANSLITQNKIFSNSAGIGGGIQIAQSDGGQITDNIISGNKATAYPGGGFFIYDSHPKIIKNLITGNSTVSYGGGIAILSSGTNKISEPGRYKHILQNAVTGILENKQIQQEQADFKISRTSAANSKTILINNTISNNTAVLGGGIYNELDSTIIINTILWGDSSISGGELHNEGGNIEVMYSDIQDTVWVGKGNIAADPLFADTLYHLGIGSPCIDAGDSSAACNDSDETRNDMGYYGGITESLLPTGLIEINHKHTQPRDYVLAQNYPNPFNPITTIEFQIPSSQFITLRIFNVLGQEVTTLTAEKLKPGNYRCVWDASGFASGVYLYRLSTKRGTSKVKKMILLR